MHKVGKLEAYPTLVSASISAVSSGYGLNEIDASNYEKTPMICEVVSPRLLWGTKNSPRLTGRVRKTEGRVEGLSVGRPFLLLTDAC